MKITFTQSLTNLVQRINAPVKTEEEGAQSFRALLRDISPFYEQPTKITGEMNGDGPSPPDPNTVDSGPMASYKRPPAEMLLGEMDRLGTDINTSIDSSEGVKTPTLLEAKRIRIPTAYQNLNKAEKADEVIKLTTAYGAKYGVDPSLATAVAEAESSFDPRAVSSDGHASKGLFQLLDGTGKDLLSRIDNDKSYDPFDPDLNTELGVSYLRYLHDLFNEKSKLPGNRSTNPAADSASLEKLAVAAFNAGEGRVSAAQESALKAGLNPGEYDHVSPYLPVSTRDYVSKVSEIRARYSGSDPELEDL